MRRVTVALLVVAMFVMTTPAYAQTVSGSHSGRPWWRLFIFVPVSVLLGAGVAVGRRIARDRGWFGP